MVGRTTERTTIWGRLAAALGSALIVASLVATVSPVLADPVSPLTVVKTADKNPVASGQQLTYTINVTNTGGAKVTNVVMTDQVNGVGVIQNPPALPQLIITSTKGSCQQGGPNGNVVTCNVGTVNGNESFVITIRGQVTAGNGTTLNNTASVTGTKSAQNFTTTGSVSVLVSGGTGTPLADLTINKTGPTTVAPNAPMTYTLTVNNIGTANAPNVRVVDTLPAGVALVSTNASSLFNCTPGPLAAPATVTCTGGAVNQGQNATITINATSPLTGPLTNTAVVDPNNTITESNELNNTSAAVNTTVGGPPPSPLLTIVKTDGNPAPSGSWWGPGGANPAGPDPVNPGQKITYKILVTNIATGTNSRADDVVTVDGTQGLEASSIVASQVVTNGTVGNTGGCVVTAPQVRCSLRSLNSGGTQLITITGTVLQSAGSSIFNTATVTGNIRNTGVTNTDSEATTVRPEVDLTITKDDDPDPVCARSWPTTNPNQHLTFTADGVAPPATGDIPVPPGLVAPAVCLGGLTYSFVIGNSGIADVTGVTVRDALPAGLIFDSYSTDAGFVCAVDASNVVVCTGGAITAVQKTRHLAFMLVAPPTVGTITNTVQIDPDNTIFEPDETNNTSTETTNIKTGIDLVIWKSDNGPTSANPADPPGAAPPLTEGFDPIATNGTDTYTIIVDNVGTQNSTGIKVRDTLPAGTKFLSVTSDHGFTCSHDGAATGGNVTCISGHLLGTEAEFYDPAGVEVPPFVAKDDFATITIKVFVTPFVQPVMHNEVRVDPDNEIVEVDELNNLAIDNTTVGVGDADEGAFNQLKIVKTQIDPSTTATPPDPDATVATNGTLIYNLHVVNAGTDPVSNVVVKDFLPTGTRFISAKDTATNSAQFFCTHDGSPTGGVITCTGGDFSGSINTIPGVPIERDIKITVFAPNVPGSYTNHATVDPDNVVPEGNEFDNDSFVDTEVTVGGNNMFNELTISKTQTVPTPSSCPPTCPANQVATSSIVSWDVVVTNTGSDPAFNIKLTDTLPAGFTFISALDTSGPSDPFRFVCVPGAGNTIDCTGATLSGTVKVAGTNPTTRTIVVQAFSSAIPGNYTNTAIVDPANAIPEGNETNNTANATVKVLPGGPGKFIDLQIDKTGPLKAKPGAQIVYELKVSNDGAAPAFNVAVRDVLPPYVTFFNAADEATPGDPGQFTCQHNGGYIDCTGGTIPAGGFRMIRILLLAPVDIEQFASNLEDVKVGITNQASVDPFNAIAEGDETNNADSQDTSIEPPFNLSITKDGPTSASQNDVTDYTIKVKNETKDGTGATAFGVRVVDPLPVGLIPLSVTADPLNFQCQVLENPVNFIDCKGDITKDETVTITVHVFVTQDGGTLDNEACVDPDHRITETNELDNCNHKVTSVVTLAPDLRISKSASLSTVTPGQTLSYKVTVANVGNAPTTDGTVTFTDTLPSEVTFSQANATNAFTCTHDGSATGGVVTCTGGDLNAGDTTQATIDVTINSGVDQPFTNTATITSTAAGETNTSNNGPVTLSTSAGTSGFDLTVASILDNPDPVNSRSSQLTYTILAQNNGTALASGAIVRVSTPQTGVSSVAVSGSNGFNCAANTTVDPSGKTYDCTGDFPAGGNTTITAVMIVDPGAPNDLVLSATVDPENAFGESDETNNSKSETTTVSGDVCTSTPCVDLVVAQVLDNPDPVANGGTITYTASVVNVGDTAVNPSAIWALDITYTGSGSPVLTFPPGIGLCAVVPPPAAHHVRCTSTAGADGMDLAPGAGFQFTVTVTGVTPGTGSLSVDADHFNAITEFSETNNSVTETTTINP